MISSCFLFFFSSRRRHTRFSRDWSSDVCSSDLKKPVWRLRVGGRNSTAECGDADVYGALITVSGAEPDFAQRGSQRQAQAPTAGRFLTWRVGILCTSEIRGPETLLQSRRVALTTRD